MSYREMIFPHIHNKKQQKEMSFIYCYHIRIVDYRHLNEQEYNSYVKSLSKVKDFEKLFYNFI